MRGLHNLGNPTPVSVHLPYFLPLPVISDFPLLLLRKSYLTGLPVEPHPIIPDFRIWLVLRRVRLIGCGTSAIAHRQVVLESLVSSVVMNMKAALQLSRNETTMRLVES
jgi:hypothetical protein